jgi:precorrin-2 dehydrogenase/sirohydrochlorin ferrochelatase/precorrin-6A/cobalt-precorrin-6A reductase
VKVLIFGGTSEGRRLAEILADAGVDVTLSVATELGREAAASGKITILAARLSKDEITSLLSQTKFAYVLDATHPYAVLATQNIRAAAFATGTKYCRLLRPPGSAAPGVTYVPDTAAAVNLLAQTEATTLLTIGIKELEPFTQVSNYAERFFVRILPALDSLQKALELKFKNANIICMQGPFSKEMNVALLQATGAQILVTKDSGSVGGFEAKVAAAAELGRNVLVIERPAQETGYTFAEMVALFQK